MNQTEGEPLVLITSY